METFNLQSLSEDSGLGKPPASATKRAGTDNNEPTLTSAVITAEYIPAHKMKPHRVSHDHMFVTLCLQLLHYLRLHAVNSHCNTCMA